MGAIIGERSKEERPDHFVRVIPTAGGDWIALCSDCSFEETTHLKVDAEMNAGGRSPACATAETRPWVPTTQMSYSTCLYSVGQTERLTRGLTALMSDAFHE